jgi:hypothetical protein
MMRKIIPHIVIDTIIILMRILSEWSITEEHYYWDESFCDAEPENMRNLLAFVNNT